MPDGRLYLYNSNGKKWTEDRAMVKVMEKLNQIAHLQDPPFQHQINPLEQKE